MWPLKSVHIFINLVYSGGLQTPSHRELALLSLSLVCFSFFFKNLILIASYTCMKYLNTVIPLTPSILNEPPLPHNSTLSWFPISPFSSCNLFVLVRFLPLSQAGVIVKGTSVHKTHPSDCSVGKPVGHFINDGCQRIQHAVGGANPGLMVLGCIFKKRAEQATESQPVSRISLGPLLQFLPWFSIMDYNYKLK